MNKERTTLRREGYLHQIGAITENTVIPDGFLALGRPAKPIRPLNQDQLARGRVTYTKSVRPDYLPVLQESCNKISAFVFLSLHIYITIKMPVCTHII